MLKQEAGKQQQQHVGDCGTEQRQRRSIRAKATPAHVLESAALISDSEPDQQTESDTEFMAAAKKVPQQMFFTKLFLTGTSICEW